MLGDCLERMKEIESGTVDMILCDLPYGTTCCSWDAVIPFEPLWAEYERVIKTNGAIVLFGAQPFTAVLACSNLKLFKYEWIWEKPAATGFLNAKLQPLRAHENALVFYKSNQLTTRKKLMVMSEKPQNVETLVLSIMANNQISRLTIQLNVTRVQYKFLAVISRNQTFTLPKSQLPFVNF